MTRHRSSLLGVRRLSLGAMTEPKLPPEYDFLRHGRWSRIDIKAAVARVPYTSIMMSRGPCFGTCPIYQVEFHRDGTAEYRGERFTRKVGLYRGVVDALSYGRLTYALDRLEFMQMKESFDAMVTCAEAVTVSAVRDPGGRKVVEDHGRAGPPDLWVIQELIDVVSNSVRWVKVAARKGRK